MTEGSSGYEEPSYEVAVTVPARRAAGLCDRIRAQWPQEPVETAPPGGKQAEIHLYFPSEEEARLVAEILAQWTPGGAPRVQRIEPRDWTRAYREQFRPRAIGNRLEIRPAWERAGKADDRITLWIDPGLSFGTGAHFTTSFCLEMMDRMWLESPPASFWDAGTGSGLLAIAAARLGCPRVVATDSDPDVLPYTKANAAMNGVDGLIEIVHDDVNTTGLRERFDLVCANLNDGLLMECAPVLARAARRSLVLSGIRREEADPVAAHYTALGGRESDRDEDGEWAGLGFDFSAGKQSG
jgi:ribosomal protein L11 methyltransferase